MKVVPLADVCEIVIGRTPSRSESSYWGGDLPWLSIADMNQGRVLTRTKERVTAAAAQACKLRFIEPGTVVMSFKLSIGKVGITGTRMATNEAIAALSVKNQTQLNPGYLSRVLESMDHSGGANRAAMGGTLNKASLAAIRIPLPPLEEQRRIAAILDKADELRNKRREALTHLDALTQSIFHSMFRGDGTEGSELGPLLPFVTSGGRGWAKYYSGSDIGSKFLRSLDVRRNFIDTESPVFVEAPDNAEAKRTQVRADDVLLTITGSLIGRAAPVLPPLAGSYVSQHVAILRPDTARILPIYLSHFLNLERGGQRIIQHMQYGQTKPGLNFEQIRKFKIPVPPLELQQAFATRVVAVERLKAIHRKHLAELDGLFGSLQHRAFKGEL